MLPQLKPEITALANEIHLRLAKLRRDKNYVASVLRKLKYLAGEKDFPKVLKALNLSAKAASDLMMGEKNHFNRQSS